MVINKKNILIYVVVLLAFQLGYMASREKFFPLNQWYKKKFEEIKVESPSVFSNTSNREMVKCPDQNDMILIVGFGQSNSANHQGQRYQSNDNSVLNFYNGACYLAKDPMLGATGGAGSIWIPLGNMLAKKTGKKIVFATFGVSGASITSWVDKDLRGFYAKNILSIQAKYKSVDYFLWIQGESDRGMKPFEYGEKLRKLISSTKENFPNSKFLLSATTYCHGKSDPLIRSEQVNMASVMPDVFMLGDTDKYSDFKYRYDDCHLSGQGIQAIVHEFIKYF